MGIESARSTSNASSEKFSTTLFNPVVKSLIFLCRSPFPRLRTSLDLDVGAPNLWAVLCRLAKGAMTTYEVANSDTGEALEFGALELSPSPSPMRS